MRRAKVVNRSQVEGKRKFRGKSGEAGASVSSRQVALVSPGWQESWIWQTCLCILHTWNIHSPPDCPLTQPCRDPARVSLSLWTHLLLNHGLIPSCSSCRTSTVPPSHPFFFSYLLFLLHPSLLAWKITAILTGRVDLHSRLNWSHWGSLLLFLCCWNLLNQRRP